MAQRDDLREIRAELRRLKSRIQMRPIVCKEGGGAGVAAPAPAPWVGVLCKAGNNLITTPDYVTGVKRKSGEAMADSWYFVPRRATATATILSGSINTITVTNPGLAYTSTPAVSVTAPPSGVTAVITATVAASNGKVEGVYLTNVGTLYTTCAVTFAAAPVGGTTATGTATLRDGYVVAITVTNGGKGYTSAPAVTLTGDGSGAAATAVLGLGGVTLAITNAGSGYVSVPNITIAVPPAVPIPAPTTGSPWPDGVGYGTINGGSLTGGLTAGDAALICHDDRSMVPYGIMGNGATVPYSRPPDSILSWYQTAVRLSIADPLADGVLLAWVPMSGGV
jgi:hypothetical protein